MGRIGPQDSDAKSRLVLEICAISTAPVGCPHRRRRFIPSNSNFVDWYRILRVAEDSELDIVKKHYHKLALQLHPDKNKHPNAEIAFKLVSEAYSCLSDGVRRKAFNIERCKNLCIECNGISYKSCNSPIDSSKTGAMNSRSRAFKDMRDRFREETRIIENCLKNNSCRRKETPLFTPAAASENPVGGRSTTYSSSRRESPVFDPGQYLFNGYPHLRSQVYSKPESFHHFHRGSTLNYGRGSERFQSPVFETVPGRGMFKSKSVCIRS